MKDQTSDPKPGEAWPIVLDNGDGPRHAIDRVAPGSSTYNREAV